jgi:hypothetical protein
VLLSLTAGASASFSGSEFDRAFAQHLEQGTLFRYYTAEGFRERGWGVKYRDAVAAVGGTSVDGLVLEVELRRGYQPATGVPLALDFWLVNRSDRDASVPVRGSCQTVHAAGAIAVDPEGRSHDWIGRGLDGGPHCFCRQFKEVVRAGSRVKLSTTIADELRVATWAPRMAGKHVVLGQYTLAEAPDRRLLSKPLTIDVRTQ